MTVVAVMADDVEAMLNSIAERTIAAITKPRGLSVVSGGRWFSVDGGVAAVA
jgi:hypothetical protein